MALFKKNIITDYVSEIDKKMREFDKGHSLSESQRYEIAKAKRIAELRDKKQPPKKESEIWEDF